MRLLCSISSDKTEENPFAFSYFLTAKGIENECEEVSSPGESTPTYRIWIREEDRVEEAQRFYKDYQSDPHNRKYRGHYEGAIRTEEAKMVSEEEKEEKRPPPLRRSRVLSPAPYGKVSILILFTVIALFIWSLFERGTLIPPKIPGVIQAPLLPKIDHSLLYDFPRYFQLRDELLTLYTPKEIEEGVSPSPEALVVLQEIQNTPVWLGVYDLVVNYFQNDEDSLSYEGPLFEQISEGEVWRLFTPCLLHFNLLHIFFNVLWFVMLANQVEYRLGWVRYLILLLLVGIVSNTAQYLMSGSFFMGLSGIVCGLAGFIWARQQVAPWEGYLLHKLTLLFLGIFVIGMFFLQLVFFFLQIFGKFELTIGIANTAHLSGALVGYLLGRMKLFSLQRKRPLISRQ